MPTYFDPTTVSRQPKRKLGQARLTVVVQNPEDIGKVTAAINTFVQRQAGRLVVEVVQPGAPAIAQAAPGVAGKTTKTTSRKDHR